MVLLMGNMSTVPSRDISHPTRFFDFFQLRMQARRESGVIFVVGAAEAGGQHQNSVFLRCATTLRSTGEMGAPVFGQGASGLSVGWCQPHQAGVAEPEQVRPWIGAAELDIHPPHAHRHLRRHFQQL